MRYWLKAQFLNLERGVGRISLRLPRFRTPSSLPVIFLTYHAVANVCKVPRSVQGEVITPDRFRAHVRLLAERGFQFLTVQEWVANRPARQAAVITFDDGYRGVFEEAFSILSEYRAKATLFVTTHFIDGKTAPPWVSTSTSSLTRDYASTQPIWRPLNWEQIRRLAACELIEIGSHGCTHRHLALMDDDSARLEILQSKQILEERIEKPVTSFSYPFGITAYGSHSSRTRELLGNSGYTAGCTGEVGIASPRTDPLAIPRLPVHHQDQERDLEWRIVATTAWRGMSQKLFHRLFASPYRNEH